MRATGPGEAFGHEDGIGRCFQKVEGLRTDTDMTGQNRNFGKYLSPSLSRLEMWERVLLGERVQTAAELGVWRGDSAKRMLSTCTAIERYYFVDAWKQLEGWNKPFNTDPDELEKAFQTAIHETEFASNRRVVLRGTTAEVAGRIPDDSLDFAYIDADHTLRGITIDLIRILPKIKKYGMIGGDDFTNDIWEHGERFEPTLVCPYAVYFAEAVDLPIFLLPNEQWLIVKDNNAPFSVTNHSGRVIDLSLGNLLKRRTFSTFRTRVGRLVRAVGLRR